MTTPPHPHIHIKLLVTSQRRDEARATCVHPRTVFYSRPLPTGAAYRTPIYMLALTRESAGGPIFKMGLVMVRLCERASAQKKDEERNETPRLENICAARETKAAVGVPPPPPRGSYYNGA